MHAWLDLRADRRYLRDVAYADASGLVARAGLYDAQDPWIDLVAEALSLLGRVEDLDVADIGCGNGRYLGALEAGSGARVVGVDFSEGMLGAAAAASGDRRLLAAGDAAALPLASSSFDVVLMMHMLYHLPDPAPAVDEAVRVLRAGGRVLAATNGPDHLAEMNALWVPLLSEAGFDAELSELGLVNPRLEGTSMVALLADRVGPVVERQLRSSVRLTDPAPVVAHAATTTGAHATGPERAALLEKFARAVDDAISARGEFRITTEVVMVLATT